MLYSIVDALKILATVSIFFVWVVRYKNIKQEFRNYNFPNWFRDIIGILKLSFTTMLHSRNDDIVVFGSLGICVLMVGAVGVHIVKKNTFRQYLPSISMILICFVILYNTLFK